MKTAIVYYSRHHGNTKKLLDAIVERHPVALIDVTQQPDADLSEYDRIGFASGIYYSAFAKQLVAFANYQTIWMFDIALCAIASVASYGIHREVTRLC